MQALGRETVRTYRYVRISIVAAILMLATALLLQIIEDDWQIAHSISAYYYSSVQPMFVGVLVASAFLLVAVRGRPGWEEALLNIAAMLLPLVAFVPTPIPGGCVDGSRCVPAEVLPAVELSISTLLIVGVPGVVGALAVWLGRVSVDRSAHLSITIAVLVWVVVLCWYGWSETWIGRESFVAYAHYVAAVLVFCFMVAVAFINARRSQRSVSIAGSDVPYRRLYHTIALAMALVIVGALVYGVANGWPTDTTLVFWVEAALLALFALFWVVQTVEFWNLGLPEEACQAPGAD
jgi:hypothetical protein